VKRDLDRNVTQRLTHKHQIEIFVFKRSVLIFIHEFYFRRRTSPNLTILLIRQFILRPHHNSHITIALISKLQSARSRLLVKLYLGVDGNLAHFQFLELAQLEMSRLFSRNLAQFLYGFLDAYLGAF